jgi:hypothetical protein
MISMFFYFLISRVLIFIFQFLDNLLERFNFILILILIFFIILFFISFSCFYLYSYLNYYLILKILKKDGIINYKHLIFKKFLSQGFIKNNKIRSLWGSL